VSHRSVDIPDALPIEIELRREKAQALGRTGRALEQDLDRLRTFELQLSALPPGEKDQLQTEHQALRKRVARRLWFLIVHREAIGLRHHESVYELYQIPRSLMPNP
jgi:hypothetical protein